MKRLFSLTGLLLVLCELPSLTFSPDVAWTVAPANSTFPFHNGWLIPQFEPLSGKSWIYTIVRNSTSIFSTDVQMYDTQSGNFTHVGGNGTLDSTCVPDTAIWPGNRHLSGQQALDTKRNRIWLGGGDCSGNIPLDMYYMDLNADPTQNRMHQITPAHFPRAYLDSAWVYDNDDDVIFSFGSDSGAQTHDNAVYCMSDNGALTAAQVTVGCVTPNDWNEISPLGGVQPPGVQLPGMVYDRVHTHCAYSYGGMTGGSVMQNQLWKYCPPARQWTQIGGVMPPVEPTLYVFPAWAIHPATGLIYYHQSQGSGAPADWIFDPVAATFTKGVSTGGTTQTLAMTVDSLNNVLVGWARNSSTGLPDMWIGTLPSGPSPPPVISSVASAGERLVTWTTDKVADSQVAYGLTSAYGSLSSLDSTFVTAHAVTLTGLVANATYHYQARSRDSQGQLSTSTTDLTFTTGN